MLWTHRHENKLVLYLLKGKKSKYHQSAELKWRSMQCSAGVRAARLIWLLLSCGLSFCLQPKLRRNSMLGMSWKMELWKRECKTKPLNERDKSSLARTSKALSMRLSQKRIRVHHAHRRAACALCSLKHSFVQNMKAILLYDNVIWLESQERNLFPIWILVKIEKS